MRFNKMNLNFAKYDSLAKNLEKVCTCAYSRGAGVAYKALRYCIPILVFPTHENHKILGDILVE